MEQVCCPSALFTIAYLLLMDFHSLADRALCLCQRSDVAFIYQRPSAEQHLNASEALAKAAGNSLEALQTDFSQPAFRVAAITQPGWWSSKLPLASG